MKKYYGNVAPGHIVQLVLERYASSSAVVLGTLLNRYSLVTATPQIRVRGANKRPLLVGRIVGSTVRLMAELPRPVFVGGLHRSGTSVLARTLATHPDIAGLRGTRGFEDEGQHVQDVFHAAWRHGGIGRFSFDEAAHLIEPSLTSGRRAGSRLWHCWAPYVASDVPIFVEKSPPNLIRTRFLQAAFPTATFILILRHPAIVSVRTQVLRPSISLIHLMRHWIRAHDLMVEDLRYLDRALVVRYEDLVTRPRQELKRMSDLIGVKSSFDYSEVNSDMSRDAFDQWEELRKSIPLPIMRELQRKVLAHGYDLYGL